MQSEQFHLHADIEERHWWFRGRRSIARALLAAITANSRSCRIVDVGCGTGANIASFADQYSCHGIDPSIEGISLATTRYPHVEFTCGMAPDSFTTAEAAADVFLVMDVMEHVPDDFLFLSQLLAVMQPGRHILITVPANESLWSPHDEAFGHYRRYSLQRFQAVWRDLPVTPVLLSHYMSRLLPAVQAVRFFCKLFGASSGRNGTDFTVPPRHINHILERLFSGEAKRLIAAMHRPAIAYSRGVSLIAVLRREAGELLPRKRPNDIPPDVHGP